MNKEEFLKVNWYVQGFNATPNLIAHGHITALEGMWDKLGFGYTKMMNSYRKDYCEYYYSWEDLNTLAEIMTKKLKANPNYLEELEIEVSKLTEVQSQRIVAVKQISLKKLSVTELIKLYQELFFLYCAPCNITHLIEAFIVIDNRLKHELKKYYEKSEKKKKFNDYFAILNQPIRPSFVSEEYTSLLKILNNVFSNEELLRQVKKGEIKDQSLLNLLEEHRQKYFWVRSNYAHGLPLETKDFVVELQQLIENKINPNETEKINYAKNRQEKEEAIKELQINDKEILILLKSSELIMHLQDDRKKQMLMGVATFTPVLYEIAERFGLNKRLILYLLPKEVNVEFLKKIDDESLQERKNGCAFLWETVENKKHHYSTELLVGEKYVQFIGELPKEEKIVKDLHGTCASVGNATGKVRICRTKEDLIKFKEGEILVTSMTRPEFVSAMKKAAAIVTDEGGITCHAAIISRELGIPCVIGTKIATKILSDGDLVEVKANHGMVKIIKMLKQ